MGRGWQEGERGTWQKRGAQALGVEGCAGAGGDPRRHNTYNRPRGHPYKNKSHLLRGRGSPAALCTQLWGTVRICTPQPPPRTLGLPMASGINMGDPEP